MSMHFGALQAAYPVSTAADTTSDQQTRMLCLFRHVYLDIAIGSYTVHIALLCCIAQVGGWVGVGGCGWVGVGGWVFVCVCV